MDVTTILVSTAVSFVGLQLCTPDGEVEKMADSLLPNFWCANPFLRLLYGLFQLLGVIFVLGFAIYLTFTEHWWYFLIYLGGAILAKIVSFLLQIPIALIFSKQIEKDMYGGMKFKRLIGSLLIILGMGLLAINL